MKLLFKLAAAGGVALLLALGGLWFYAGSYGIHVLLRHGGTYWLNMKTDDARLSPSIRLALRNPPPVTAGPFAWRQIADGFEVAELPVMAADSKVDEILLARIDPAKYRFEVRNDSSGSQNLDQWMSALGAALVVNASYYSVHGLPDTPIISNRSPLGPQDYSATSGAFVASPTFLGIRDLAHEDWKVAFGGADNAMVSYPLLVAEDHQKRNISETRWLAARSFVGQDNTGRIIIGTTKDAFFSLARLSDFLLQAPLDLKLALNLDGGPVASQGVALNGYDRRLYGKWELQVKGDDVQLLTWPYGTVAMPMVLVVFPKSGPK